MPEHDLPEEDPKHKSERRAKSKKRRRYPRHGGALAQTYRDAVLKRAPKKQTGG